MDIALDYYRIFEAVARHRSFTRAAEALVNSQPNLTRAVHNLEAELGCRLFLRSSRGVELTPEGEALYAHVTAAMEQLRAGEAELQRQRELRSGMVSIACSETALHAVLLQVLSRFHRENPAIRLRVSNQSAPEAIDAVGSLLEPCGREVCRMNRPAPGFIANRLQHALYREAVYMVEQGICAPADIDKCIRSSWGPRYTSIGLFDHFDYAGLDLIANIETYLYPDLCDTKTVHPSLQERLNRGDLGYKTGVGYYDWRERDMDAFRKKTSDPYLRFFNWKLPEEA